MPPSAPATATCEHCGTTLDADGRQPDGMYHGAATCREYVTAALRATKRELVEMRATHDAAVADARRGALEKAVRECERGTRLNDDGMLLLPTRDECIRRIRALAPSPSEPAAPAAFISVPSGHPDAIAPKTYARLDADRTAQPKTEIRAAVAGHNGPVPWPGAPVAHVDRETGVRTELATSAGNAGQGVRWPEAVVSAAQQMADAFTPGGGGLILSIGGVEAERRLVDLKEALAAARREGQR